MKDGSDNGSNQHMDPTIISNVPKAMFQKYSAGEPITSEPPVVAEHRALFMQRAFGTGNEAHKQLADNMHDSDSRESSVRHENELENICYILKHWGGDINLKEIQDDEILRKKLSKFRRDHAVGKHHVGKYHFHEITLPSGERRNILRRIERGEVGRIVVSRDEYLMLSTSGTGEGWVILVLSVLGNHAVRNIGTAARNLFVCSVTSVLSASRRIQQSRL
jgi:hypothetical protein